MDEIRQEGIIVRAYPSGEADLVLRIVTPGLGKISAIAKHARKSNKRFSGGFEVFDRGEFTFKVGRSSLYTVTNFNRLPIWRPLREDLDKFTIGSLIAESFDLILKEESAEQREMYEILALGFEAVAEAAETRDGMRAAFLCIAQLMQSAGFHSRDSDETPSAHSLAKLLVRIEQTTERDLKTKAAVQEVIERLRVTS